MFRWKNRVDWENAFEKEAGTGLASPGGLESIPPQRLVLTRGPIPTSGRKITLTFEIEAMKDMTCLSDARPRRTGSKMFSRFRRDGHACFQHEIVCSKRQGLNIFKSKTYGHHNDALFDALSGGCACGADPLRSQRRAGADDACHAATASNRAGVRFRFVIVADGALQLCTAHSVPCLGPVRRAARRIGALARNAGLGGAKL